MVKKPFITLILCWVFLASQIAYAQAEVILLNDGSKITGNVVSFDGTSYVVNSPLMGNITLRKSDIQSISNGSGRSSAQSQSMDREFARISRDLNARDDLVAPMTQLSKNALIQQILNNPSLMQSIQQQDWDALQNDPMIRQLMNDPQVKAISQQLH